MNFYSREKQIFQSFGSTKIRNDLKCTKASRNEVIQPTTIKSDSRPIFPYYFHNKAGFDNPFINKKSFIYLAISKMSFALKVFTRVQDSTSIKAARKGNI